MARTRIRYTISGNVQGVGFRWTTRQAASGFDVSGYVRNCSDGTVEIVAEGEPTEIRALVDRVRSEMRDHIADIESERESAPERSFQGFTIKH
jgi:acylphosphatase